MKNIYLITTLLFMTLSTHLKASNEDAIELLERWGIAEATFKIHNELPDTFRSILNTISDNDGEFVKELLTSNQKVFLEIAKSHFRNPNRLMDDFIQVNQSNSSKEERSNFISLDQAYSQKNIDLIKRYKSSGVLDKEIILRDKLFRVYSQDVLKVFDMLVKLKSKYPEYNITYSVDSNGIYTIEAQTEIEFM